MIAAQIPEQDALSELLLAANIRARVVESVAAEWDQAFRFPGSLDGVAHLALRGSAWVSVAGAARWLVRGEVALLPKHASSHVSGSPDARSVQGTKPRMPTATSARAVRPSATAFQVLTIGCECQNVRSEALLPALGTAMFFKLPSDLLEVAEDIAFASARNGPGTQFTTARRAEALFGELIAVAFSRLDTPATSLPALRDARLSRVLHELHAKPEEAWTVQRLSHLAGLSRAAFCRRFLQFTGQSPANYRRQLRVCKASALLRTTTMSVSEVALAVGFESESSFSRAFLAVSGERPGDVRIRDRHRTPLDSQRGVVDSWSRG